MDADEYQRKTSETAIFPDKGTTGGLTYTVLGLCGEAGEVAEKVKKMIRDNGGILTPEKRVEIAKEASDCAWYLAQLSHELGFTLSEIMQMNLDKLASRKQRGVLHGSGDER